MLTFQTLALNYKDFPTEPMNMTNAFKNIAKS